MGEDHSVSMDERLAAAVRPDQRVSLKQRWAELLFLHWEVDADAVQRLLPAGLTVDLFEGKAYVGLVPFTMTGVRPVWAPPVRGLSSFHETNVRTYVHCRGRFPGVWFFSLDATNAIAVWIGRTFWSLNYFRARMSLLKDPATGRIDYLTRRLGAAQTTAAARVTYTPLGQARTAQPDTLEHFLAERYIMYAQSRQRLYRGYVHHVPYPLQDVTVHCWEENLLVANQLPRENCEPCALYAREVQVDIFPLKPVLED